MKIVPVEAETAPLDEIAALLRRVFRHAQHFTAEYLRWQYFANPDGNALAFNACVNGRVVAHFGAYPLRARWDGSAERGLVTVNAVTDENHRGRGLFVELVQQTMSRAADDGFTFALALANAASVHAFCNRLDFRRLRPIDVRVGIGAAPAGSPTPPPLWTSSWTRDSLAWRLAWPTRRYATVKRGATTTVYADTGRAGIWMDLGDFPSGEVPDSLSRLPRTAVLRGWMGLDRTRRWTLRPYLPLPARLRPAPLNFCVRDLRPERPWEADQIRFRGLDFDAY